MGHVLRSRTCLISDVMIGAEVRRNRLKSQPPWCMMGGRTSRSGGGGIGRIHGFSDRSYDKGITMKSRRTAIAAAVGVLLGAIGFAGGAPAQANVGNGPASSGVVERFDSPGFTFVPDVEDGLVVFVNVNSIADACNGIPAGAGVEQVVFTPNGRVVGILQDDDVPLIVAPIGPPEAVCGDPAAWPVIATGSGNVRSNSGGFRVTGTVEEPDGQLWNVQAAFGPNAPDGDVNLVKRGQ